MSGRTDTRDLDDETLREAAVAAARGDRLFDMLIRAGTLVDMVTGERRPADIGLVGPLIASVHLPDTRLDAHETIDASGLFLSPGLIDTHMHVESSMITPAAYAAATLPRGVTTLVWDPHELGNVHGIPGIDWAAEAARMLPQRHVLLAPSCVPSAPGLEVAGADFSAETIAALLSRPEIGGIAEVMDMRAVIEGRARMSAILAAGRHAGKPIHGHARSLAGPDLQAFITAGISSDHEIVSGEDLLAKLHAGLTIELRGSHDHLLPECVAALNTLPQLPQTLTLCTDDVFPDDLFETGGLDDVVRRLVRYGMKPEWALQAATLNAARRIGRNDLGLIAPGRRADIVLFEDLTEFRAKLVLSNGRLVARNGALTESVHEIDAAPLKGSMHLAPLREEDFRIPCAGTEATVAVIAKPRFTEWAEAVATVSDGFIVPPDGTTLIAVAHRHGRADARPRVGLLSGWGTWRGALATTVSHDSHNLTVFGGNARDMAAAANAVIEAGGGMAVAADGRVLAVLALPLSGLLSDAPLADVATAFTALRAAADGIVDWQPPYLVFKAVFGATLACNAGPHQTDRGIADGTTGILLETPILSVRNSA
ncbi:amidohydrolase family protein [Shinella kummerowiae]|uniref:Adenine deaminase n=1 Tax=Shinella kummerowiae TaxID=417745 RepID=A0A6N8SIE2_9HYPH|nr:adenine deaminase C-terminal domain-containing protein [Shinella kummerowiae]MXN48257.1 amidohydrolase family protein [Shinella kummerowiae]